MKINRLFLLCLTSSVAMLGKFHTIVKDEAFDDLVNKYEYAVVCLAPSRAKSKNFDKDEKKEIAISFKDLKKRLKEASESEKFKQYLQQEVGFLLIDTASSLIKEVDEEFAVETTPTCLLFKHGKVVLTARRYAQIYEPFSKFSILSFLSKYFKHEFNDIVAEKKDEEEENRKERIARYQSSALVAYPYGAYGYYSGYPYDSGFYGRGYFGNRYYGGYGVGFGVGQGYSYGYW